MITQWDVTSVQHKQHLMDTSSQSSQQPHEANGARLSQEVKSRWTFGICARFSKLPFLWVSNLERGPSWDLVCMKEHCCRLTWGWLGEPIAAPGTTRPSISSNLPFSFYKQNQLRPKEGKQRPRVMRWSVWRWEQDSGLPKLAFCWTADRCTN